MRAVNLLPRDGGQRQIKKESLPVLVGACVGVLVAALLGAMFMMGSGKVAAQQRKVDDLNRQLPGSAAAPGRSVRGAAAARAASRAPA